MTTMTAVSIFFLIHALVASTCVHSIVMQELASKVACIEDADVDVDDAAWIFHPAWPAALLSSLVPIAPLFLLARVRGSRGVLEALGITKVAIGLTAITVLIASSLCD